jgi:hypothetical protein
LAADRVVFRSSSGCRGWILAAYLVAALSVALRSDLRAQENPDSAGFYFAIAPGISIGAGPEALHFSSYSAGVAFEYGPAFDLDGAAFKVSLESGYSRQIAPYEKTTPFQGMLLASGYTPIIRRVPIMIWWTVESRARVSPFIRFGVGISWTQYTEDHRNSEFTLDGSDWGFTWGIGGGIRLRMNPKWSLAIFLDDWVSIDDVAGQVDTYLGTYTNGIHGPIKMTMIGIRGTMKIF